MTKDFRLCMVAILPLVAASALTPAKMAWGAPAVPGGPDQLLSSFRTAAGWVVEEKDAKDLLDKPSEIFFEALSRSKLSRAFLKRVAEHVAPDHARRSTRPFEVRLPAASDPATRLHVSFPIALHMTRLDVIEDYDDVNNDNLFIYSVSTYGDMTWGRVSPLLSNLDEGQGALIPPDDQGIFGPRGQFHVLERPLTVDFGIVESDQEDVTQLRELSRIVVEAAALAFAASEPSSGPLIRNLRDETNELLAAVASLDGDDRLVTASMTIDPIGAAGWLGGNLSAEIPMEFSGERNWSRYGYRLWFRILRE